MNRSGDAGKLDQTGIFYRNIFYYDGDKCRLFIPEKWANYDIVMDYNLYYDASGKPPKFLGFDFAAMEAEGAGSATRSWPTRCLSIPRRATSGSDPSRRLSSWDFGRSI